eukprot:TRINITY_DN1424_c0_g2_i12.p1 TRINITY_DN1424_c0_g2~~TRINITY_DN1424_c0_g2_i12.p1  ORF type:complete len:216 (+),score=10.99 TRINITY_DN1424_c0_g2_i12:390-1037(+)
MVFASSGGVLYGDVVAPAKETLPENPISPYGISKWTCEQYLKFFAREHGIEAVSLRYANVYGPRQNPHGEAGVVAIFCQRLLNNETPIINGDGSCARDYVYCADVARANLQALTADSLPEFCALNIGTGSSTNVRALAHMIRDDLIRARLNTANPSAVPQFEYGPARAGDLKSCLLDAAKASRLIDWRPSVALRDGLEETVSWFLSNKRRTNSWG